MERNINELPENCLILILSHLPVKEILKVATVCRTWSKVQEKVCHQCRSLNIRGRSILNVDTEEESVRQLALSDFLAFFDVTHYDLFEPYYLSSLFGGDDDRIKTSTFLVRKFPNLRRFSYYGGGLAIKDLMNLLSHWKKLTHLTLIIPTAFNWDLAWKYINSLQSLKRLSLIADGVVMLPRVMPRLQQFDYATVDGVGKQLSQLIGQLNQNTVQRIGIGCFEQHCFDINRNQTVIKRLVKSNPWIASKVTRFSNHLSSVSIPFLNFICANFSTLQFLNISFADKVTFDQILTKLSQLANLKHLRLGSLRQNANIETVRLEENNPLRTINSENVQNIPQLTSVRELHIYDFECDNTKLHFLELMFPAVKNILIQDQANFCWHAPPFPRMSCEMCPYSVFQTLTSFKSAVTVRVISKGDIVFEKLDA